MAGFSKPKVYTGVAAALSVADSTGALRKVAYVTGFTLDLSANTEDFTVIGQRYQESIPTYNNWTASSDAKASFENRGQSALLAAYQQQEFILCEFILNDGKGTGSTVDSTAIVKAYGYASIESLSIDAGEGVTGISISLKGSGNMGFSLPSYKTVNAVTINKTELTLTAGSSEQLIATVTPANATEQGITWTSADPESVTVDELGFVYAVKATGEAGVVITAKSDDNAEASATCTVTVK